MARFTLLVPTYNRPACLRSLLGYFAARRFAHPIRVLDSSSGDALAENRDIVAATAGLALRHDIYDPKIPGGVKFAQGVQGVETPYSAFCPDDDLVFTDAIDASLDFLDANPGMVAAHGNYLNFRPAEDFEISAIFYWAPSI